MGSKFYHLRIPGGDPDAAAALCPGCAVRPLAGGWVAVSGPSLAWGTIQREARRLSRALPVPVLSTEYFDGDYVELALYRGGRRVARHVPASYESLPRCPGRSRAWAEQLGLSAEAERALAAVFREGSPEVCLRLLECVLGCPLWGDGDGAGSSAPPGQACLTDYLAQRAGTEKLRGRTRLVLLDQVEGDFGWDLTYPAVREEPEAWRRSFWDIRGGALRRLCACLLPEESPDAPPELCSASRPRSQDSKALIILPIRRTGWGSQRGSPISQSIRQPASSAHPWNFQISSIPPFI